MKYLLIALGLTVAAFFLISFSSGGGVHNQSLQTYTYAPVAATSTSFRYLGFQIFTTPLNSELAKRNLFPAANLEASVKSLVERIGVTGGGDRMAAFIVGPLTFSHSAADIRKLIDDSFALAETHDIAVGFHIDDSMFWEQDASLNTPGNIEWVSWDKMPYTGRRLDWSETPTKIAPQLCLNSPGVVAAVDARATLIAEVIAKNLSRLEKEGKGYLFAGVIAGWETQLGRDFDTGIRGGYCALANKGFSRASAIDLDREREAIVKEFIDRWTGALAAGGIADGKIYSHIAFQTEAAFRSSGNKKETYSEHANFAPLRVAFGAHHRPGFSTYPAAGLLADISAELAQNSNPPWASSEGSALDPAQASRGSSGVGTESYLAGLYNRGAVLVTIFGWGLGPPEMPFRKVAESNEAVNAYRKFLAGEPLVEKGR